MGEVPSVGPMPGHDNIGVVIECGACRGQDFKVQWVAAPVAAEPPAGTLVIGFPPLQPKGVPGGVRLSPRYFIGCAGCGAGVLLAPEGPDPLLVRGDVGNN